MKKTIISLLSLSALFLLNLLVAACSGEPKQSKCFVEVYIPGGKYTDVKLLNADGGVIDSTLTVKNDSIRFARTDSLKMPYVAQLQLLNPNDSLDFFYYPIVIEGGTVKLNLTERISLSGTKDNEALFKFLKAKNSFSIQYENKENPDHDVKKLHQDYSRFYADQILLFKGTVVGDYLLKAYGASLTPEDYKRVEDRMRK